MLKNTRNFFKSFGSEFKQFITKGNAIDMAVGVIVGSVLTGLVNSLVKDIIMPPIGLLLKGVDFSEIFIVLKHGNTSGVTYHTAAAAVADGATTLNIGIFINAFITFLITMTAIFLIVKVVNRIRENSKRNEVETMRDCPYCIQKVSVDATKCPFCCSALKPVVQKVPDDAVAPTLIEKLGIKSGLAAVGSAVGKTAGAAVKGVAKVGKTVATSKPGKKNAKKK